MHELFLITEIYNIFQCERSHRTWKDKIRHDMLSYGKDKVNWAAELAVYNRLYNEGIHSSLGKKKTEMFISV